MGDFAAVLVIDFAKMFALQFKAFPTQFLTFSFESKLQQVWLLSQNPLDPSFPSTFFSFKKVPEHQNCILASPQGTKSNRSLWSS